MKKYQVLNNAFEPVPHLPFDREACAVSYIRTLQETYSDESFYVLELNITSTVSPAPRPAGEQR